MEEQKWKQQARSINREDNVMKFINKAYERAKKEFRFLI